MNAYWRAANYLSVGQIYLYDNPLLRRPIAEYAEHGDEYLLADQRGYLYREHAHEYEGTADFYAPLDARRLAEQFRPVRRRERGRAPG